jgi:predicted DNA binding CopG/RHH family protein
LRVDRETIERLKLLARRRGIGYQTLIRMWVMERLRQEK